MPRSATVLVVENEPDLMELVRVALEDIDVDVVGAEDGAAALTYLQANAPPALILLDFNMPNMDGFEFRAHQLKDAKIRSVPVVFMTAIDQIPAQRDRHDRVLCLKKPFSVDELTSIVKDLVG